MSSLGFRVWFNWFQQWAEGIRKQNADKCMEVGVS